MFKMLFISLLLPSLALAESFTGKVVGIADGDTITVMREGRGEKVRLDGIDCPENGQDFGRRAKTAASDIAFGNVVSVVDKGRDKYGRTIGVVSLQNGTILNNALVESGLCWWYREYAPRNQLLKNLEAEARAAKRGLWSHPNPIPPWEYRLGARSDGEQLSGIIGNRNSRVYHRPDCPSYYKVSPKNRVPFSDEAKAEAAGYRVAGNCPGAKGEKFKSYSLTAPAGAPIIGNKRSKIFHLPNCPSYNKVSPKNRVYYDSAEAARAA